MKDLKGLVDEAKKSLGSGVVAIVGVTAEGKAGVVVGVTPDLTQSSTRSTSSARRPPRSAAGAAAAGPTWRRPAVRTARRPPRRSTRWRRGSRRPVSPAGQVAVLPRAHPDRAAESLGDAHQVHQVKSAAGRTSGGGFCTIARRRDRRHRPAIARRPVEPSAAGSRAIASRSVVTAQSLRGRRARGAVDPRGRLPGSKRWLRGIVRHRTAGRVRHAARTVPPAFPCVHGPPCAKAGAAPRREVQDQAAANRPVHDAALTLAVHRTGLRHPTRAAGHIATISMAHARSFRIRRFQS